MAGGDRSTSDTPAGGESERGKRASFDPRSGEVHGSGSGAGGEGHPTEAYDKDASGRPGGGEAHGGGSGAGGGGKPNEDYDKDPMAGAGAEPGKGPRPAADSA